MPATLGDALARLSVDRAAERAVDLCAIPSPTGDTVAVTARFAQELRELGLEVELFTEYPATPVAIARLRGRPGGRTLVLNGHLDTVPFPHEPPVRRDGRVYGRGAVDMKGPLAAAVEALQAAREAGLELEGDVLLCAHGLHEAPGGHAEDLQAALRAGRIRGDAAIVLELGHDSLPVVQMGMGIFRVEFRRPGPVLHEMRADPETPNPIELAADAVLRLAAFQEELEERRVEHAGCESVFVGQFHGGDFYNRLPDRAGFEGTRRYAPERTGQECLEELRELLEPIAIECLVGVKLDVVREGCRIDEGHPLVDALRSAYREETGRELPVSGTRVVADAPIFAQAGIPCLYHGLAGEGAHGDVESVPESELLRGAGVYLRTMAHYLGTAGTGDRRAG